MANPSQRRVEEFFANDVGGLKHELKRIDLVVSNDREPANDTLLARLASAMNRQTRTCLEFEASLQDGDELRCIQERFQRELDPWFSRSWFMHRAKTKPRGYPGDYELLNGIYDNRPKSKGLGGYLDLHFLGRDLARAVRARMEAARAYLSHRISSATGEVRVLNVASGPCREYFVGLEYPTERNVRITCIDSDSQALRHVQHRLERTNIQPAVEFVNYNALRMRSAKRNVEKFGHSDIIYSIGLLDYIPDKHLVPILEGLRLSLSPGGALFVAFKDELLYNKAEYQWMVDWFFFQRKEEDCLRLLSEAGFGADDIVISRDATNIIINFECFAPRENPRFASMRRSH